MESVRVLSPADADRLAEALDRVIAPWRSSSEPLSVLYSGGVDSSLLAWELRAKADLALVTVGRQGSPDLKAAARGAELLGRPLTEVGLPASEIEEAGRVVGEPSTPAASPHRSVLVALLCAVRHCGTSQVLCGQGVDELFLGYAHFRGLSAADAEARSNADLRRARAVDAPAAARLARTAGHELHAPFLEEPFVSAARAIPIERRLPAPSPKTAFRVFAEGRGLPRELAWRPKRALQYGSGVDRTLRAFARERGRTAPVPGHDI
jgi:asparagine synthase (glutamine-hydrolysing)